jgi:hypothetical protein
MPTTTKVLGWGKCSAGGFDDIVENSCQLSVEEGAEQEATIEGGSAEGRRKAPDKYILTFNRRIGDASEVTLGFTETVASVVVVPELVGAIGCTLTNPSKHVAVKFDATDGLVAVYTFKTKGATDASGNLTDITFQAKTAG